MNTTVNARLIEALKFYADKNHLMLADPDAWDTVSGEPENFLCDDAGTATVEDGSVARAALAEAEGQAVPSVDAITQKIADMLSGTYHCMRVWSAWNVGTMSEDDFEDVGESDTPREIAEAVLSMLAAAPEAPAAPTVVEPVAVAWTPALVRTAFDLPLISDDKADRLAGMFQRMCVTPPRAALTDEQIERHSIKAGECPPDSKVMLVRSIHYLLDREGE